MPSIAGHGCLAYAIVQLSYCTTANLIFRLSESNLIAFLFCGDCLFLLYRQHVIRQGDKPWLPFMI